MSSLLATSLLGAGVLVAQPTPVHALTDVSVNDTEFPLTLTFVNVQDNPSYNQKMLLDVQKKQGSINNSLYYDIVNEDTGALVDTNYVDYISNETRFRKDVSTDSLKDGTYHIDMYTKDDFGKKAFGRSVSFKIAGGQFQSFPASAAQRTENRSPVLTDDKTNSAEFPLKLSFINVQDNPSYNQKMLLDVQKEQGYIRNSLYYDIVNEDTGALVDTNYVDYISNETRFRKDVSTDSLKNGTYHIEMYTKDDFGKKAFGRSVAFKVVGGQAQPDFTSGATPTPTQSGWVGSSYYQDGAKVKNKWIFDKNYNSYFYLDASGNYVQNAWVGNYYLKAGGYMAKNEWIFDKNYGSFYYLTSEGSYARNTWSGRYYLKGNGKMAKSEWIYDKNYGSYYYITADGSYAYSKWVGKYYLKGNGKMAKNEWIYDRSYSSYYYLTSEGSYAYSKWVGDYYLKGNGKMAVNERTPDGYRVDGSGKWIR